MPGANLFQARGDDPSGNFRAVAILAQMSQKHMLEIGGHDLGQGVGGGLVGKMAVPAHDALFEAPGAPHIVLE